MSGAGEQGPGGRRRIGREPDWRRRLDNLRRRLRLPRRWSRRLRALDAQVAAYMPPVVRAITYACVVVFAIQWLLAVLLGGRSDFWVRWLATSLDGTVTHLRLWQPLTYVLLHGSVAHLATGLLGLIMLGTRLEQAYGSSRFLKLCVVAALCGALTHLIGAALFTGLSPGGASRLVPIVGLSGVVYAIVIVFAQRYPSERFRLWGVVPVDAKALLVVVTIATFLGAASANGLDGGAAHLGHVGGLGAGFLFLYYPDAFDRIPWPRISHRKWTPPARRG